MAKYHAFWVNYRQLRTLLGNLSHYPSNVIAVNHATTLALAIIVTGFMKTSLNRTRTEIHFIA